MTDNVTFPAHLTGVTFEDAGVLDNHLDDLDDGTQFEYQYGDPESSVRDNNRRAGMAARGIVTFAERVYGGQPDGEDLTTTLGDFLGDFMHLCDLVGLDFDSLVDTARMHYEPELRGAF